MTEVAGQGDAGVRDRAGQLAIDVGIVVTVVDERDGMLLGRISDAGLEADGAYRPGD